jgi:translation initiation factor 2B subunit (eIF-2B alpha/beta/delta family)
MNVLVQTLLEEIKDDRTSGAAELVQKGGEAVSVFLSTFGGPPSSFPRELTDLARRLITCQPSMAPFFHLANLLLLTVEDVPGVEGMKKEVQEVVEAFLLRLKCSGELISNHARALIPAGSRVFTHSYSSTVLRVLTDARRDGRACDVVCTEARPLCEGFQMAGRLREAGIPVQVEVDAASIYRVKDAGLVLVGADCLSPLGLVNKVGTYGLALAARERRVPFYALCSTEKLLGLKMVEAFRIVRKDPREVWPHAPEGLEVVNFYFDTTPLDLLTAIVTEDGVLRGSDLMRRFQTMRVSREFPARETGASC